MTRSCHRRMIIALCAQSLAIAAYADNAYQTRKLNRFHMEQLNQGISESISKVNACSDPETRCKQQQELCKKLIQAEKYDQALQVAEEVYQSRAASAEQRAAHHYLQAEIYCRKMKASPDFQHMQQNRQLAVRKAQEVLSQNYPAKWRTGELAENLMKELQDPQQLQEAQKWVQKRQAGGVDASKKNLAKQQLQYMEQAAGGVPVAASGGMAALKRTGSSLLSFGRKNKPAMEMSASNLGTQVPAAGTGFGVGAPGASSSVNLKGAGMVTFSRVSSDNPKVSAAAVEAVSAARPAGGTRAPIIIDGATIRRSTPIGETGMMISGASTSPVAATYANGQMPARGR